MSDPCDHLLRLCGLIDCLCQKSIRVDELEDELLRRDIREALKEQTEQRRQNLRSLAEIDQITADIRRQMELKNGME